MTDDRRRFSDHLIECESPTPSLHDAYRKEIATMFNKKLGPVGRSMWAFWTIFALAQAVVFGCVAFVTYGDLPLWGTVGFAFGIAFALAWAGLCGWIAVKGQMQLTVHPPAMAGLAWAFMVIYVTLLLVYAPDSITGVRMLVTGLVFLVGAAVFLLASRTEQAELRTKEKLLEIEYRIADLGEQLKQRDIS